MTNNSSIGSLVRFGGCLLLLTTLLSCKSKKVVENEDQQRPYETAAIIDQNRVSTLPNNAAVSPTVAASSNAHFAFDSAVLSKEARTLIRSQASEMKKSKSGVLVTGACDERGSFVYNQKLGLRRAQAVRAELEFFGVSRRQIRIQSIGKNHPVATGHDELAWAQNRRAEMEMDIKIPLANR